MWLIAEYRPVALFSLKVGEATSTGAKTVLLPTPFAIRTALLDVAIRTRGESFGPQAFRLIKSLRLAIRPPERAVVTNLFTKVLKPQRPDARRDEAMQPTISFREYAFLQGDMSLAFEGSEEALGLVETLLLQINYFGKRGSFFQLVRLPYRRAELPQEFVLLDGVYLAEGRPTGPMPGQIPSGIMQLMDDWGPELTYEKVNIYTGEPIKMGKDRVRKGVVLPYRLSRYSRGFSYYEKLT